MVTPRRRLFTSGKGAPSRSGTFAPGGSTSSPSWAWETPLKLSALSQVRKASIRFFQQGAYLDKKKSWLFSKGRFHVLCWRHVSWSVGPFRYSIHVERDTFNLLEARACCYVVKRHSGKRGRHHYYQTWSCMPVTLKASWNQVHVSLTLRLLLGVTKWTLWETETWLVMLYPPADRR